MGRDLARCQLLVADELENLAPVRFGAGFPGGAGTTMTLGFPIAPMPFELRVDEAAPERVSWTSVGEFPPHWVGTRVLWTLTPQADRGATLVHFSHDGWATDEGPFASSALTWGRLMDTLKRYAETGIAAPLFPKGLTLPAAPGSRM